MLRLLWVCVLLGVSLFHISAQTPTRPLILPFQSIASINTWLLGQPYGNTLGAYNFGTAWYSAGQGLHFGLDFSAPCQTPLVAVANGTVVAVDNFAYGSRPHNLLIRHDALGLVSLYGHLYTTPDLIVGQPVTQGQFVGYSGDPDETCESRPHLHYELRSLDYLTTYNPIAYMDANWHTLGLIGSFGGELFAQDLDNARRWMSLDDQPNVQFGGARLNAYAAVAPLPQGQRPPANPPLLRELPTLETAPTVTLERIGSGECCKDFAWHPTQTDLLYIVDGAANTRAVVFEWLTSLNDFSGKVSAAPRPILSPDGTHEIIALNDQVLIRRLSDSSTWQAPTSPAYNLPAISPDNARLLWIEQSNLVAPGQELPPVNIFTSGIDGQNITPLAVDAGTNAQWLDATRLLLTVNRRPYTSLEIYDTATQERYVLGTWYRLRGLSIAPGGGRLLFYLSNQADPNSSGIYTLATQVGAQPQKLAWFGAWRWRDAHRVYYVPFNPAEAVHQLYYYDLLTGNEIPLTDPTRQPFTIMNGKWEVSADGLSIAFHNEADRNLWIMQLEG